MIAFDRARQEKEVKYANFASELSRGSKSVKIEAFIVGSLGSWHPKNNRLLDSAQNPIRILCVN